MNGDVRDLWVRKKLAALPKGTKILDVGAGTKPYFDACSHLTYMSQDFNGYDGKGDGAALQAAQYFNGEHTVVCDICDIPFQDQTVDHILCTEVLEHVPDPVAALKEMCRLIRPGGFMILTAPFNSLTHFSPFHFCSGFNHYWYEHWFKQLGFDIVEIVANGDFFQYMHQELTRLDQIEAKYSKKRHGFCGQIDKIVAQLKESYMTENNSNEVLCFGYQVLARKK